MFIDNIGRLAQITNGGKLNPLLKNAAIKRLMAIASHGKRISEISHAQKGLRTGPIIMAISTVAQSKKEGKDQETINQAPYLTQDTKWQLHN